MVFIACSVAGMKTVVRQLGLSGGRRLIREAAVQEVLRLALERLKEALS